MKIRWLPFAILVLWWFLSSLNLINSFLLPSPIQIIKTFSQLLSQGYLLPHILASFLRLFLGFGGAIIIVLLLVFLFYKFPYVQYQVEPIIRFIQHIPPLALLTLIILWFGIGELSKIVLIMLASFFPLFINTYNGIQNCNTKFIDLGKIANFTKKEMLTKILLPNALPYILSGIRLGFTFGWRALIGAELIATNTGLGAMIIEARELSRSDIVIVGVFCFGIIGILIERMFFISIPAHLKERMQNVSH